MKIAVNIGVNARPIEHGLWTIGRGEARWGQNVAALLGSMGHEVTGFSNLLKFGWGACPAVPGVTFQHDVAARAEAYDLLFDSAFSLDASRWNARCVFEACTCGTFAPMRTRLPPNVWLIAEYPHTTAWLRAAPENAANHDRVLPIYFPHLSRAWWAKMTHAPFAPPPRDTLFLGSRFTSGPDFFDSPELDVACALFDTLMREQDRGWRVSIAGGAWYAAGASPAVDARGIPDRVETLRAKGARVFDASHHGELLDEMNRASVFLGVPAAGGSPLEAIVNGAAPIVWTRRSNELPAVTAVAARYGLLVPSAPFSAQALAHTVDVLLTNSELRHAYIADLQAALEPCSPEGFSEAWTRALPVIGAR